MEGGEALERALDVLLTETQILLLRAEALMDKGNLTGSQVCFSLFPLSPLSSLPSPLSPLSYLSLVLASLSHLFLLPSLPSKPARSNFHFPQLSHNIIMLLRIRRPQDHKRRRLTCPEAATMHRFRTTSRRGNDCRRSCATMWRLRDVCAPGGCYA